MEHSCGKLLWDTLVGHSYTLVGHSCRKGSWWTALMGHSRATLLWGTRSWRTLVGEICGTLLQDTPVQHSCGTFLWDTPAAGTNTAEGHSCRRLLYDTLVGYSCFLQNSRVKPPKRAFSYETSSKSQASSLEKKRFVRVPQCFCCLLPPCAAVLLSLFHSDRGRAGLFILAIFEACSMQK